MSNKRKMALTIIGVLICVCAVLGVSYAYWVLVLQQKDSNIVSSDCFSIEFEEGETISLQNTFPIAYSQLLEFFQTTTPYHFKIVNKCDSLAKGVINLETLPVEGKVLSDEYVALSLYEGARPINEATFSSFKVLDVIDNLPVNEEKVLSESQVAYKLIDFELAPYEEKEYDLYLWLDEFTPLSDEVMNTNWSGKITITTSYWTHEEMLAYYDYELSYRVTGDVDVGLCISTLTEQESWSAVSATQYCNSLKENLSLGIYAFSTASGNPEGDESYWRDQYDKDYVDNFKLDTVVALCNYKMGGNYVNEDFDYINGNEMNPVLPSTFLSYPVIGTATCLYGDDRKDHVNSFNGVEFDTYYGEFGSFVNNRVINSVTFPDQLEIIGDYSFYGNRLSAIQIPTKIRTIGESAFQRNQLTRLELNPSSTLVVGVRAFNDNQITEIVLNGDIEFEYESKENRGERSTSGVFKNNPVEKIINNTGKAYNWAGILTGEPGDEFETGSLEVDGKTVEIVKE